MSLQSASLVSSAQKRHFVCHFGPTTVLCSAAPSMLNQEDMMTGRHVIQLGEQYVNWLVLAVLAVFIASCGAGSRSSLSLPEGSSGDKVPLYPDARRITVNETDRIALIGGVLGTESLRYDSNTDISWTEDTGTKVQEQLDELLPDANYRIESDWSGFDPIRTSSWRNGDIQLAVFYIDNLNSEQIGDLRRRYGISGLQPGSTLIVTHVWDTTQPLPTATPTATPTPLPTSTPTATFTSTPTPLPTATPTPTPTPTLTPTPTPTPLPGSVLTEDDFDDGNANGWLPTSGSWNVVNGEYICVAYDGRTFIGEEFWTDYVVSAAIRPLSGRIDIGVLGRVRDEEHFYLAQLLDNNARLYRRNGGLWEELTDVPYALEHNQTYQVELEFRGTRINMYVNDALVTSVEDAAYLNGYVGLRCAANVQAFFDNVTVVTVPNRQ